MQSRHILSRFAFAMGVITLAACSSADYIEEDSPSPQPLRIVTTTIPLNVAAAPIQQEMINSYTLIYINKETRRVEAIQDVDKADNAVEYDVASFPIEISEKGAKDSHVYRVYAFANFTSALKEKTTLDANTTLASVKVGDILSSNYEATINGAILDLHDLNGYDFAKGTRYIPMTAVVDYNATMQYHQPVNVPLVRMLAKLNFKVCNNTYQKEPLRLQKISIRPVHNAPVYVLPHLENKASGFYPVYPAADSHYYGANANAGGVKYIPVVPSLTYNAETKLYEEAELPDITHVTLDLTENPVVLPAKIDPETFEPLKDPVKGEVLHGDSIYAGSIYVNESLAKWHPTGQFAYDLYFIDTENGPHEYRYALSANDFKSFLRNDDVTIILTITSLSSLEPEVIFYPPIGGYPPVITRKNDDEFYATFSTIGDFAIYPHIYRDGARTDIRLTDATQVEFSTQAGHLDDEGEVCQTEHLTVTGDNIFTKQPRYSAGDNCIKATLGSGTGHAIVTITAKMLDSNQVVSKKIHIIRE